MERLYSISDASSQVQVENHVLRYWEEELGMNIRRNSKGHRCYSEKDISVLKDVKDLKEQGFLLRAIKYIIGNIHDVRQMSPQELYKLRQELNDRVASEENLSEQRKNHVVVNFEGEQSSTVPAVMTNEEKMQKFEKILKKIIENVMNEDRQETEKRICDDVTTKMMKELNYQMMQRDEAQAKQMEILNEILANVSHTCADAAASQEIKTLQTRKGHRKSRTKLFAK